MIPPSGGCCFLLNDAPSGGCCSLSNDAPLWRMLLSLERMRPSDGCCSLSNDAPLRI